MKTPYAAGRSNPNTILARLGTLGPLLAIGVIAAIAVARGSQPNFRALGSEPLAVHLHLAGAIFAFGAGAVLLAKPKGNAAHRALGWSWAAAMTLTAISSLFITSLNDGDFSFIHLFSGWVIIALPAALYAARRRRVKVHRGLMLGMYLGGMFIAGGFAFAPGRLLWEMFLH